MARSNTPILLVVAVVTGALAGAGASVAVLNSTDDARSESAASRAAPSPDGVLVARLDALEAENMALRDALAALENRPPPVETRTPLDGFVSKGDFDAFREEMLAALTEREGDAPEAEVLKEKVADALTSIRKEERVDKVRDYQEKRVERIDQDVEKLEDWLELTTTQSDGMRTALLLQYERENEQRRLWEEESDLDVMAERKRTDGAAFRTDLEQVLTPDQFETFWTTVVERGK